jgi:DNA primase
VSPDKQFYHCFGCGAHGTALGFLMEYDHLGFVEAVEDLAARAGLEVPREGWRCCGPAQPHDELYVAMERAALYFRQCLSSEVRARDYVAQRGITAEIGPALRHRLRRGALGRRCSTGTAHRRRTPRAAARGPHHRTAQADAGIAGQTRERGFYDRFRDRVMFPIRDTRGRTIGFGGRVLDRASPST